MKYNKSKDITRWKPEQLKEESYKMLKTLVNIFNGVEEQKKIPKPRR